MDKEPLGGCATANSHLFIAVILEALKTSFFLYVKLCLCHYVPAMLCFQSGDININMRLLFSFLDLVVVVLISQV